MNGEQRKIFLLSRRGFLSRALLVGMGFGLGTVSEAAASPLTIRRSLSFYHIHTRQELSVEYAIGLLYNPFALRRINQYLGDFRTGESHVIDPALLDLLWVLQKQCGKAGVFSVISGYRSPQTNLYLRKKSKNSGVAQNSLHMQGRAIDVRFSEASTSRLRTLAVALHAGGVGFYPVSNFIHLDTGRYRTW